MKINSIVFIQIIILLLLFSCKKDKIEADSQITTNIDSTKTNIDSTNNIPTTYDTIFPLDYFPAFPGSYWKYVDSNNDTTVRKTDSLYKKDYYTYGSAAYVSDTFYVPIYNNIPIWKYEEHTGPISHSGSYPFRVILSETLPVGSDWPVFYWSGTGVSRKLIAKDTTITISSIAYYPTIVIEEYYSAGPPHYIWIAKRYYTKNIGLIREDLYNNLDSTTNTKELIDYFINI